jgi:predicted nucleic acid-binding protein
MRVFLDANVLFSAAYMTTGSPRALFILARAGACEIVSSGYAVEEARRNIGAKHPRRLGELESLVGEAAICREPAHSTVRWALSLGLPDKDAPILAAAVDAGCNLLITGDVAHFGSMFGTRQRGTVVLRPADAFELLIGKD